MRVRDLPLTDEHTAYFEGQGIDELFPPQAAAVEAGVCAGNNIVAAVPTAAGKTFIAELGLLTAGGPGLYICPLRALAREKHEEFAAIPGIEAGIATGDYDTPAEELATYDIVVATSEKVDSAIRNGASWVDNLACVAIDEVHLLGTTDRGPTLEVTLATLRRRTDDAQTVALSATVANPEEIAGWLNAELVESDWRPVDLRTGVYADGRVEFDDGTERGVAVQDPITGETDADTEATVALVREVIDDEAQALAFVSSRKKAERLAQRLAEEQPAANAGVGMEAAETAEEIRRVDGSDMGRRLAEGAAWGVAFHHAGLRSAHRSIVENAFRDQQLLVICATPTLAAGVNVPSRRVVIRDQHRFTETGSEWLPTLEIHQMCGRAGRPGLDPYGEAVLVGDVDSRAELWERYVETEPEAVESQLRDRAALRTHTLALVAAGLADSQESVLDQLSDTFYAARTPNPDLGGVVGDAIADLIDMDMLAVATEGGALAATPLGRQVSRQYVTPETGRLLVEGLRSAARLDSGDITPLTVLEVACDTPDMPATYLGDQERAAMYQFARKRADELTTGMTEPDDFEGWLESVKTARMLVEWLEGEDLESLVDRYRVGPGDLESRIDRARWLLGAATAIAGVTDIDLPTLAETRDAFEGRAEM